MCAHTYTHMHTFIVQKMCILICTFWSNVMQTGTHTPILTYAHFVCKYRYKYTHTHTHKHTQQMHVHIHTNRQTHTNEESHTCQLKHTHTHTHSSPEFTRHQMNDTWLCSQGGGRGAPFRYS